MVFGGLRMMNGLNSCRLRKDIMDEQQRRWSVYDRCGFHIGFIDAPDRETAMRAADDKFRMVVGTVKLSHVIKTTGEVKR